MESKERINEPMKQTNKGKQGRTEPKKSSLWKDVNKIAATKIDNKIRDKRVVTNTEFKDRNPSGLERKD
jgi:hypothetical protein